ncbi:MAG: hypothetical protein ACJ75G_06240 [Gaiellaceae bacterium]
MVAGTVAAVILAAAGTLLLRAGGARRSAAMLLLGIAIALLAVLVFLAATVSTVSCPRGCKIDHPHLHSAFVIGVLAASALLVVGLVLALWSGSVAMLQHVPGFRWLRAPAEEQEGNAVAIRADTRRMLLLFVIDIAFVAVAGFTLVRHPDSVWAWAGEVVFGVGGCFAAYRLTTLGVLAGRPLLVLDEQGIRDNRFQLRVRWGEVAMLELWEQYLPFGPARSYLGIRTKSSPLEDRARLRGTLQAAMRVAASTASTSEPPELSLPLSELAVDPAGIIEIVRRYWDGPIGGLEIARGARAERNPWHRIAIWSAALVVAAGAFLLWLAVTS